MISFHIETDKQEYKKINFIQRIFHNRYHRRTKNKKINKRIIFEENKNLSKNKTDEEIQNYFDEESKRLRELVKRKTGRKSQIQQEFLEGIITVSHDEYRILGEKETNKRIEEYLNEFKKQHKIKIHGRYIHQDEGHYDEKNNFITNYHVHIIFNNINEEGRGFLKSLGNYGLRKLQDQISNSTKLKRGVKNSKKPTIGMNYKQYTVYKIEEREKDKKIRELEQKNKEMGKDIETLKNTIKTIKNDTIKEQEKDIKNYKELMEQFVEELKEENKKIYKENKELITKLDISNQEKKILHNRNKKLIETRKEEKDLYERIEKYKEIQKELKEKREKLKNKKQDNIFTEEEEREMRKPLNSIYEDDNNPQFKPVWITTTPKNEDEDEDFKNK